MQTDIPAKTVKGLPLKKKSSYLCILVDNEKRHLFDIPDSCSRQNLSLYFSIFPGEEHATVKYVTIDLWESYKAVAKTYLPHAIIAVVPVHVVKHLIDGFEQFRIDLMKQCPYDSNSYYLLKMWHWLLTADKLFWDNQRVYNHHFNMRLNRRDLFHMIMEAFPVLDTAYSLKEASRKFNKESTYEEAVASFDALAEKFRNSGIRQFDEFTSILFNWKDEILNSFKKPYGSQKLSNAYTEHVNGQIRTYLSVSGGVGNFTRFRKRVIYALSPEVYYALASSLQSEKISKKKRGAYNKIQD